MSQFRALAGVIASAAQGVVTMFTATPALDTDDANQGNSFRILCTVAESSLSHVRVTLQPGTSNSLTITHASVGKWAGDPNYPDTTAAPIELTFLGNSGFAGARAAQVSDWVDVSSLSFAPGDTMVVIYDILSGGASTASQRYDNSATNATTFYQSIESWNISSTIGLGFNLVANTNFCVASIETQNGGGGAIEIPDIPMSFDDALFTGMTESASRVTLQSGEDLSRYSIVEASGEPSITCLGNNELAYCRVDSRECIRITDNDLLIQYCYLESTGTGDDHADTLQAYSPGARGGTVTLKNTHVRAHTTAATAGLFIADNWGGDVVLEGVIFQGGPYGMRIHADATCHINVSLKDVYFVGPFGGVGGPYLVAGNGGGTYTVVQWDNVREATIVDGELVPGNLLPSP
jgi:hypothetical protein